MTLALVLFVLACLATFQAVKVVPRQAAWVVDGVVYYQVTDPMRASYGAADYVAAITQLSLTALRSAIGRIDGASMSGERATVSAQVTELIAEAALNWGVTVLRFEIKDQVSV